MTFFFIYFKYCYYYLAIQSTFASTRNRTYKTCEKSGDYLSVHVWPIAF